MSALGTSMVVVSTKAGEGVAWAAAAGAVVAVVDGTISTEDKIFEINQESRKRITRLESNK